MVESPNMSKRRPSAFSLFELHTRDDRRLRHFVPFELGDQMQERGLLNSGVSGIGLVGPPARGDVGGLVGGETVAVVPKLGTRSSTPSGANIWPPIIGDFTMLRTSTTKIAVKIRTKYLSLVLCDRLDLSSCLDGLCLCWRLIMSSSLMSPPLS
jgi:hypothetical protein